MVFIDDSVFRTNDNKMFSIDPKWKELLSQEKILNKLCSMSVLEYM